MQDSTPIVTRHRHESRRRGLTVQQVRRLTPSMIRIVLGGEALEGFVSLAPDDHVKLFLPGGGVPVSRDYTPRHFDPEARTLTLDFAIHAAGPATDWALTAQPGDNLEIGGPRGSAVVAPLFDWWLLIGDETALPAIGRRLEELPAGTPVITLASVPSVEDEQAFDTQARHRAHWLYRPLSEAANPSHLLEAARKLDLPPGKGFVWIAAEAGVARALRDHFLKERQHPQTWLKSSGYWQSGLKGTPD
ncbi:NADPH-dependent ferric siderophore reductase, contains FAD-binding and SIP domains [Paracoccus pantotrophus]|nr:NADPH-dependent ferric siderophore reductase, contains FAD-binding and SIP domains [Paracoccus pantotrophus]